MKNKADYSQYKCPYSHIEKECGHNLIGPEGFETAYGIWCACGFRGPALCLGPEELGLEKKEKRYKTAVLNNEAELRDRIYGKNTEDHQVSESERLFNLIELAIEKFTEELHCLEEKIDVQET